MFLIFLRFKLRACANSFLVEVEKVFPEAKFFQLYAFFGFGKKI